MSEQSFYLDHVDKAICIFGSARHNLDQKYYDAAYDIASMAVSYGYATITGAGPGIMESANRGCFDAEGYSIGVRIQLPFEQETNPYCHEAHNFDKFYSRKCMLVRNSDIFVAMPGGFGTLDELFEVLTLIQCAKLKRPRKIILFGAEFWNGLADWMDEHMKGLTINKEDLELFQIVDSIEEVKELL